MRPLLLIISIFLFFSCGNTADTISEETLDGQYALTGIGGNSFSSEEIHVNFNPIGNSVSGNTGCNRFSANYRQKGRELTFATPISTRKYCEGKMRTERQLLSSLERAAKLVRDGNDFVILSEGNQPLITLTKTNQSEQH